MRKSICLTWHKDRFSHSFNTMVDGDDDDINKIVCASVYVRQPKFSITKPKRRKNLIVNEIPETPWRFDGKSSLSVIFMMYVLCVCNTVIPLNCLIFSHPDHPIESIPSCRRILCTRARTQPMGWFLMWSRIDATAAVNNSAACLRIDWDANLTSSNVQCVWVNVRCLITPCRARGGFSLVLHGSCLILFEFFERN